MSSRFEYLLESLLYNPKDSLPGKCPHCRGNYNPNSATCPWCGEVSEERVRFFEEQNKTIHRIGRIAQLALRVCAVCFGIPGIIFVVYLIWNFVTAIQ